MKKKTQYIFLHSTLHTVKYTRKGNKQKTKQTKKNTTKRQKTHSAEIPIREDERGDEGPEVESKAQPAGAHLYPHSWHTALHGLGGGVWSKVGHRWISTI